MKTVNEWLSLIFAAGITFFLGIIFDWGMIAVGLCLSVSWFVCYLTAEGAKLEFEQEIQIATEEAENRELINKALKHYAETKGIK